MTTWLDYLKKGLSRKLPEDRLSQQKNRSLKASMRNLYPFISRHWRKGMLGACLIIFSSLLGFPQPLINRFLIDKVLLNRQLHLLAIAIGLMLGVRLISTIIGIWQSLYFTRFEQEVILDIQQDLLNRALRFPKSFFDAQETGYLMSRLSSDVQGLRWFFSGTFVYIASNILRLVGGAIFLFYLEWRLAILILLVAPGLGITVRFFSQKIRALSHQTMERQANVFRRVQESLSSTQLIKAYASEEREVGRVMGEMREAYQIALEQKAVGMAAGVSIDLVSEVAKVLVLIGGAYLVIQGNWSLGSLFAFQSYMGYVFGPIQYLANVNFQFQGAMAALERVSALYDIVPEETGTGIPVERLSGAVEFRKVSFSYDEQHPVLQEVSCTIRSGEHVAIVGPSGVGKTTLVSLLLRFYKPTAGEIWFDGHPAADYELSSLRRQIGYVSQGTLLLSGTIIENLRYGNTEASEEQVMGAAKAAGIHDFIISLPEGYNAKVGEKGVNLSEGQKQRLSIARALIKDPDILVLDEPTSALDSIVEKSIFEALPVLLHHKTLFVVAHRLATIQKSNRILLLNENRLIAIGTHQELLESNEFYRSLVSNQMVNAGSTPQNQ
jgi:ABC-type multidrug transport system fused ATPase/permease subunit